MLIGTGMGKGTRRIHVSRDGDHWRTDELWTKTTIRPYFNDFVVLNDYLYGFDTGKFLCINLKDGSEAWHATGYGNGQVLLLADQQLLLIMSEQGEVALVPPDRRNTKNCAGSKPWRARPGITRSLPTGICTSVTGKRSPVSSLGCWRRISNPSYGIPQFFFPAWW